MRIKIYQSESYDVPTHITTSFKVYYTLTFTRHFPFLILTREEVNK